MTVRINDLIPWSQRDLPDIEAEFSDFTLYFLAYNYEGKELTEELKKNTRFGREGMRHIPLDRIKINP